MASSSGPSRDKYFCVVCGALATPQEKQILFEDDGDGNFNEISIHHNCYNNKYQPLSKAEIKSTYTAEYGTSAVKHALAYARHAAGPNSIDNEPQEFYLSHEVLDVLEKYKALLAGTSNDNISGIEQIHYSHDSGGDKNRKITRIGHNLDDLTSISNGSKKSGSIKKKKKKRERRRNPNVSDEVYNLREEYKSLTGHTVRGRFANDPKLLRSYIEKFKSKAAQTMEANNSVGGNGNNSNNNDNNNNSNNTNDDEFVLESTFDIAGDELDVLNSEDNDEEQVDNKIDEEEEMESNYADEEEVEVEEDVEDYDDVTMGGNNDVGDEDGANDETNGSNSEEEFSMDGGIDNSVIGTANNNSPDFKTLQMKYRDKYGHSPPEPKKHNEKWLRSQLEMGKTVKGMTPPSHVNAKDVRAVKAVHVMIEPESEYGRNTNQQANDSSGKKPSMVDNDEGGFDTNADRGKKYVTPRQIQFSSSTSNSNNSNDGDDDDGAESNVRASEDIVFTVANKTAGLALMETGGENTGKPYAVWLKELMESGSAKLVRGSYDDLGAGDKDFMLVRVGGHAIRNMNLQAVCRLITSNKRPFDLAFTTIDRKNSDSIDETSSVSIDNADITASSRNEKEANHVALKSVGATDTMITTTTTTTSTDNVTPSASNDEYRNRRPTEEESKVNVMNEAVKTKYYGAEEEKQENDSSIVGKRVETKENTPSPEEPVVDKTFNFTPEHFQFILSSVKTIGRKWRAIAKKFYGSFGVVVDDMKSTNLIKRQFYNACKAIKVPFDNDRYCFLRNDYTRGITHKFASYMMSEIRAGRFELPDHANVDFKDGDVDLDDYYRKNPSASDKDLSLLAKQISVDYDILKLWYDGKHGSKNAVSSSSSQPNNGSFGASIVATEDNTNVTGSSSPSIPNNEQNDNAAVASDSSGSSSKSASNTLVKNVIVTGRKTIEENEKHHESDGDDRQKGDEGLKNTLVINSNEKNSNYNQPQEIQIEDEADDKMDEDDQMEEDDEVEKDDKMGEDDEVDNDNIGTITKLREEYFVKFGSLPQDESDGYNAAWLRQRLKLRRSSTVGGRDKEKKVENKKRARSKSSGKKSTPNTKKKVRSNAKIGYLNYEKTHERMKNVKKAIEKIKKTRRHPYVGKEVWKYFYPRFVAGFVKDVVPTNIKVGDRVEIDDKARAIITEISADGIYVVQLRGEKYEYVQREIIKVVKKPVIMNHVVEYANGTVENVNKDEIKKLLAPLKPNDGVVTRFYKEDPTLWVVEHRCVQHANSGSTWIFGIRQLRKPKNNFSDTDVWCKGSRKEYVQISDFTPVKLLKAQGSKNRFILGEEQFW